MEQQPAKIDVTRQALYEQIWSMPVSKACRTYGLSDVGIAKICARWNIPRPPRGYWAKLRNGKSTRRTRLPPIEQGNPVIFSYVLGQHSPEENVHHPPTEADRQRDLERKKENQILVGENLIDPHPLVALTERSIRSARTDESGIVRPRAKGCLDLAVSPASIDRSLRILDAILKALDRRGIPVTVAKSGNPRIQTQVLDETIGFRLAEETKRQEREPTAAEKKRGRMASPISQLVYLSPTIRVGAGWEISTRDYGWIWRSPSMVRSSPSSRRAAPQWIRRRTGPRRRVGKARTCPCRKTKARVGGNAAPAEGSRATAS